MPVSRCIHIMELCTFKRVKNRLPVENCSGQNSQMCWKLRKSMQIDKIPAKKKNQQYDNLWAGKTTQTETQQKNATQAIVTKLFCQFHKFHKTSLFIVIYANCIFFMFDSQLWLQSMHYQINEDVSLISSCFLSYHVCWSCNALSSLCKPI